ncbi:hypothetical protein RRG08_041470 [Elysia crispata]|uniref:Uncharacterized protein n=1 Tax=Elysia crispata TaxID=231223 RepID=A0AAE1CRD7_9GAST|nr:hypothetical protein RRG08_041470 [Elysia crispata]
MYIDTAISQSYGENTGLERFSADPCTTWSGFSNKCHDLLVTGGSSPPVRAGWVFTPHLPFRCLKWEARALIKHDLNPCT